VGSDFQISYAPPAQYIEKFQVAMAGGEVPDFAQIYTVAQLPALLDKNFTDLTEVLSGDNITMYPGLANIPTASWRIPELNGRLWGVPLPRPPAGMVLTTRGDVLEARGIDDPNVELRDGQDFIDLLEQLTDKGRNQFAMGADPNLWLMRGIYTMIGGPNGWAVEDGRFVNQIETEQYRLALVEASKIVQSGYLHPNSFSEPGSNVQWFNAGTTALYFQWFVGWNSHARSHPEWKVGNIELPRWGGGGMAPVLKNLAGFEAFIAIRKSEDRRLEQLLRIADYQASPFGTREFLDANYGVAGYTYDMVDGNPVNRPAAASPGKVAMGYLGSNGGAVLYGAGDHASVDAQYEYLSRVIPRGVDDASWGLYSETAATKGATMVKRQADVQRQVMLGQTTLAAWDEFVVSWKSEVGDAIAAEYADAAAG